MTHYRRYRREGGTYFFTVNLANRSASHLTDHIDVLRNALATTRADRWMQIDAMVVLPDHLHAIWTLPAGDADFSTRWRLIKSRFSRAVGLKQPRTASQVTKKEHGLWQRRFWENYIRDDADFAAHLAYCWGNPVKYGLVTRAVDWPYSSLHRDIKRGLVGGE